MHTAYRYEHASGEGAAERLGAVRGQAVGLELRAVAPAGSRDMQPRCTCSCNPEGTLRHCDVGKFTMKRGVPATAFPIRVLRCRAVFLPANDFHDFIAWCAQEWLHLTFMSRDAFRMQPPRYDRSEESGTWVESSSFRPRRFSTKVCDCSLHTMLCSSVWPGLVHCCDRFPASAFLRCYLGSALVFLGRDLA